MLDALVTIHHENPISSIEYIRVFDEIERRSRQATILHATRTAKSHPESTDLEQRVAAFLEQSQSGVFFISSLESGSTVAKGGFRDIVGAVVATMIAAGAMNVAADTKAFKEGKEFARQAADDFYDAAKETFAGVWEGIGSVTVEVDEDGKLIKIVIQLADEQARRLAHDAALLEKAQK